jgi:hypothetical protein
MTVVLLTVAIHELVSSVKDVTQDPFVDLIFEVSVSLYHSRSPVDFLIRLPYDITSPPELVGVSAEGAKEEEKMAKIAMMV